MIRFTLLSFLLIAAGLGSTAMAGPYTSGSRGQPPLPSPLHEAVRKGDLDAIKTLLASGADLGACHPMDETPLHLAVHMDRLDLVELLLEAGANVEIQGRWSHTPLGNVVSLGMARLLRARGASLKSGDSKGGTPIRRILETEALFCSMPTGSRPRASQAREIAAFLVQSASRSTDLPFEYGLTSLHLAARLGYPELVRLLIDRGWTVNARDDQGNTPLHECADPEIAQLLLDRGADPASQNIFGQGPVFRAAEGGRLPLVRWYLEKKMIPADAVDGRGTPLIVHAVMADSPELIRVLASAGANLDAREARDGYTALHRALAAGKEQVAGLLIDLGIDVNAATPDEGRGLVTPLHLAATVHDTAIIARLLEAGARPNPRNSAGKTPLGVALELQGRQPPFGPGRARYQAVIDLLGRHGGTASEPTQAPDPQPRPPEKGTTPPARSEPGLPEAAAKGDLELVRRLLATGADVNGIGRYDRSPLHEAAEGRNLALVEELLAHGAMIDAHGRDDETPLHAAAGHDFPEMIDHLLQKGAPPLVTTTHGDTPLHRAAGSGATRAARLLLDRGAALDVGNNDGNTPLHLAARHGASGTVSLLLERGARADLANKDGHTPLMLAIRDGRQEVEAILRAKEGKAGRPGEAGGLALHSAIENGDARLVAYLLDQGASPQATDSYGLPPLHKAVDRGNLEIATLLLDHGADLEARGWKGQTALHVASRNAHVPVATLLLDRGARITAADADGADALFQAIWCNWTEMVDLLITRGADAKAARPGLGTPLHSAVQVPREIEPMLIRLLAAGAVMDAADERGRTPLHYAVLNGTTPVVTFLLDRGADPKSAALDGWQPIHVAARTGRKDVLEMLLARGAKADAVDGRLRQPLHLAAECGRREVVRFFRDLDAVEEARAAAAAGSASATAIPEPSYQEIMTFNRPKDAFLEVIQVLLAAGAKAGAPDASGSTPLHAAAESGEEAVVKALLAAGADRRARDGEGLTPGQRAEALRARLDQVWKVHAPKMNGPDNGIFETQIRRLDGVIPLLR